jgi:hypothetical protein
MYPTEQIDLYSGVDRFEPRLGHRLFCVRLFVVYLSPSSQIWNNIFNQVTTAFFHIHYSPLCTIKIDVELLMASIDYTHTHTHIYIYIYIYILVHTFRS